MNDVKKENNTTYKHRNEYAEIKNMCNNYLEGLEWTFNYYTGKRMDWSWCYNYNYAPLLYDLQHIIPYADAKKMIQDEDIVSYPRKTDVEQLSYTLPSTSYYLLPVPMQRSNLNSVSPGRIMNMEWAYCRYFWECHVIF
jgi:5'-3' exonuclease